MMINVDILDIVEVGPEYGKILPLAFSISIFLISLFIFLIPFFSINSGNDNFSGISSSLESFNVLINLGSILGFNSFIFGSDSSYQSIIGLDTIVLEPLGSSLNIISVLTPENTLVPTLQISILGESLYSIFSLPLILSTMILLLGLVTPIVLSRNNSNPK